MADFSSILHAVVDFFLVSGFKHDLLVDIGLIIIAAALLGIFVRFLKQPLILGYVIAGFLIGPALLALVQNQESIALLSELGIAFLLFVIGIEMDIKKLKSMGSSIVFIGILQCVITFAVTFVVVYYLMHLKSLEAIYIGWIVAFSSTMVVVKILSDADELDSIHGKVTLGVLVVQDLVAVIALSFLSNAGNTSITSILSIVLKGAILFGSVIISAKYILPKLLKYLVESQELLFVGSLTICFFFAAIAMNLGYSIAIGAFLAGLALAATPFNYEISARIKPLRDFFAVIFFVTLGMSLSLAGLRESFLLFAALLALVLLAKPLIVFMLVKMFKYGNRSAFFSATALAQVSEFSLILATAGYQAGNISNPIFMATTLLTVVTLTLTAYIMKYDEAVYQYLSKYTGGDKQLLEKEQLGRGAKELLHDHIIVFGTHRMGMQVIDTLVKQKQKFVVVDYNPERVAELKKKRIKVICTDMSNHELYDVLEFSKARMVISTVNNYEANQLLIKETRRLNKDCTVLVSSRSTLDAIELYTIGANYVVVPESLGGEKLTNYLTHLSDDGIKEWGKKHKLRLIQDSKSKFFKTKYGQY